MKCACGCGQETPLSSRTDRGHGYIKGEPRVFVPGHHRRKPVVQGYRQVKRARGSRLNIRLHRVRAEQALGHPLPPGAVVHHADGSRSDIATLVICQDQAYHALLHARMRTRAHGGDPNTEAYCSRCAEVKPVTAFKPSRQKASGRESICRACRNARNRV